MVTFNWFDDRGDDLDLRGARSRLRAGLLGHARNDCRSHRVSFNFRSPAGTSGRGASSNAIYPDRRTTASKSRSASTPFQAHLQLSRASRMMCALVNSSPQRSLVLALFQARATPGKLSVPARALRTPSPSLWDASSVRFHFSQHADATLPARAATIAFSGSAGPSARWTRPNARWKYFHSHAGIISPARCQRPSAVLPGISNARWKRPSACWKRCAASDFPPQTAVPTQQTSDPIQNRYA